MNIYLVSQSVNNQYDTYSDIVVAAKDEESARMILPDEYSTWDEKDNYGSWAYSPDQVTVKLICVVSDRIEAGVILAFFHAG